MGFAENIKYLRESHGMKQPDIAKIAGVSFQAVSAWERGKKSPRMDSVIKIAEHFNINLSDLIDEKKPPVNIGVELSDKEIALIAALRKMDDPIREETFNRINIISDTFPRKDVPMPKRAKS